ncbi:hypothetical protein SAMN02745129_2300 [Ferrimonas marina]|uniref:Uncharacterized protein n=1 Tax=Ferrimonas marina TaxID=299255 RepID=A0A1M5TX37_9GAMM|nr:hypothetical protein SAMN02745129_2300 [Ferrimonas marina]
MTKLYRAVGLVLTSNLPKAEPLIEDRQFQPIEKEQASPLPKAGGPLKKLLHHRRKRW